jgi:hypothetical protein
MFQAIVVEVVLPEELLGFLKVGGEAHVAGQTVQRLSEGTTRKTFSDR